MFNLAERRKKRCVKIEKKIGAAGSFCMDQSYFSFLFRQGRKSKQSGLSKSEKSLAKRNATYVNCLLKSICLKKKHTHTHTLNLKQATGECWRTTLIRLVFVAVLVTYCRRQRGCHFLQFPNLKASLPPSLIIATINNTKKQTIKYFQ